MRFKKGSASLRVFRCRLWYFKQRDAELEKQRRIRATGALRERERENYKRNRDAILKHEREERRKNPERFRASDRKRRLSPIRREWEISYRERKNALRKKRRAENRESEREKGRAYYKRARKRILARIKDRRKNDPVFRSVTNGRSKKYRESNPEKFRAAFKRWLSKNPDYFASYRDENRDVLRQKNANRARRNRLLSKEDKFNQAMEAFREEMNRGQEEREEARWSAQADQGSHRHGTQGRDDPGPRRRRRVQGAGGCEDDAGVASEEGGTRPPRRRGGHVHGP